MSVRVDRHCFQERTFIFLQWPHQGAKNFTNAAFLPPTFLSKLLPVSSTASPAAEARRDATSSVLMEKKAEQKRYLSTEGISRRGPIVL